MYLGEADGVNSETNRPSESIWKHLISASVYIYP